MLRKKIDTALKAAMKARDDKARVSTLRLINAAIKDRDIAARSEDRCDGITDPEIFSILSKMVKQREDSAQAYDSGCRPDLAEKERVEISVIQEFLPKQMDDAAVKEVVDKTVAELNATSLKDMGRCMALLKDRHTGELDFGKAGALMKKVLGAG
ncbi:MAG: GatB/YqeY domain-containing protein [Pseudomonadota bacterium]